MKNPTIMDVCGTGRVKTAVAVIVTLLATAIARSSVEAAEAVEVVATDEVAYGETYAEHSAAYWQWFLSKEAEGHPGIDLPEYNVKTGQRGKVWFLPGLTGTVTRDVTIPAGKAVFVALLNAEASSLEEEPFFGATEEEQRAAASAIADHIVGLTLTINGEAVENLEDFRVVSPQFEFTAPTPWIFGAVGGSGTAVADGYYVLLNPLPKGTHTIRFTGAFVFTLAADGFDAEIPADVTYNITVK